MRRQDNQLSPDIRPSSHPSDTGSGLSSSRWRALEKLFAPDCVAVIGASATRGKWSNDVFRLLAIHYKGTVVPVNPQRDKVEGISAYPAIGLVPRKVDYAIIVVARDSVLDAVRECITAKVAVVHVLSAGFAEVPGPGRNLQRRLTELVRGSETVLIGPNAMGAYGARAGLTFASGVHFEPGPIAFISQSGGLCYDVLARGQSRGLAFGKILSVGNCADLDWPDFIRYFASDPETEVIAIYIESVTDGERLFRELQAAARAKPVIVLKGGKTEAGGKSVASHTGRLTGDYDVWKIMLKQAGVMEVASLEELLVTLEALKLSIAVSDPAGVSSHFGTMAIGTGGGATVLTADACENHGIRLSTLERPTRDELERAVPDAANLGGVDNPLDIGADRLLSDPQLLASLAEIACSDPNITAVLLHINLVAIANNLAGGIETWKQACQRLGELRRRGKIVVLVLRNGDGGEEPEELQRLALGMLRKSDGLAVFTDLDAALSLLQTIARVIRTSHKVEPATSSAPSPGRAGDPLEMIDNVDLRQLLETHGIAIVPWRLVTDLDTALAAANDIGYPVALKSASREIVHKSDVGCVRIDVRDPDALRNAYNEIAKNALSAGGKAPGVMLLERMTSGIAEVMIGLKRSAAFGSMILVGIGGIWVEVMRDYAIRLCPVGFDEALEMIGELRGMPLLNGGRGRPAGDLKALAEAIVAVSRLGTARPDILELDLNPVMVMKDGQGVVAVDARAFIGRATGSN